MSRLVFAPRLLIPLAALLAGMVLLGACDGGGEEPATSSVVGGDDPVAVVEAWLRAIASGDGEAASYVDPVSVAFVAAVENGLDYASAAAMVRDGLTPAASRTYWERFTEAYRQFGGPDAGQVAVGQPALTELAGVTWAVMPLESGEMVTGNVVAVRNAERWQVDLVGTVGPLLGTAIADFVAAAPPGEDGDVIRATARDRVAPALEVARDHALDRAVQRDLTIVLEVIARVAGVGSR